MNQLGIAALDGTQWIYAFTEANFFSDNLTYYIHNKQYRDFENDLQKTEKKRLKMLKNGRGLRNHFLFQQLPKLGLKIYMEFRLFLPDHLGI